MKTATKTRKRSDVPRLSRDDWLDAAYEAATERGFDSVRVLTIADVLGVTRGSFYWHFTDHADLIAELLERWRAQELQLNQALQADCTNDPAADLERLLDSSLAQPGSHSKNMRFELAVRDLGRRDAQVAKLLAELDDARMSLFIHKFEHLTGDRKSATDLAALFYLAVVGCNQALSRPSNPPNMKEYLKGVISDYLIGRQTPPNPSRKPARTGKHAA